jgi:hypothetical protein
MTKSADRPVEPGESWQTYSCSTLTEPRKWLDFDREVSLSAGSIIAIVQTNDNLDYGVPTEEAGWTTFFRDRDELLRRTNGGTHQGIGSFVRVTLDGEVI